jgi:hypothetical protein
MTKDSIFEGDLIRKACEEDDFMCKRFKPSLGQELLLPIKELIDYEGYARSILKRFRI